MKKKLTIFDCINELEQEEINLSCPYEIKTDNEEEKTLLKYCYLYFAFKSYIANEKYDYLKMFFEKSNDFDFNVSVLRDLLIDVNFGSVFLRELKRAINLFVTIARDKNKDESKIEMINTIIRMSNTLSFSVSSMDKNDLKIGKELLLIDDLYDRNLSVLALKKLSKTGINYNEILEQDLKIFVLYYLTNYIPNDILYEKDIYMSSLFHINKITTVYEDKLLEIIKQTPEFNNLVKELVK